MSPARRLSGVLIWLGVGLVMAAPVLIAGFSPYLAYRAPAYIIGGFAGILCLALLVIQPLLAAGYLPGPGIVTARKWHRRTGAAIVACVLLHVGGLYLTSPPDTLDALLLVSPTPFSVYGVLAMWGILATALLVALRRRLGLRYPVWRLIHNLLALMVVVATVIHALQIEGAMGALSKWALCLVVLVVTAGALLEQRLIQPLRRRRVQATGRIE